MDNFTTLCASIKQAARNNMTTRIGGGIFSPAEQRAALAEIDAQTAAYRAQRDEQGARATAAEALAERRRAELATLRDDMARAGDIINAQRDALAQAIEAAGFAIPGPTDHRAAEHGEPAWVCNARAALAMKGQA